MSQLPLGTTLYGLDNCDTCRKARNWLQRFEVEHGFVDYREHRLEPAMLRDWARQLGGWDKLVNKASTTWRNLPGTRKLPGSEPEWTLLIKEHPAIVKRPVLRMPDGTISQGFSDNGFKTLFGISK
ncbi:MAG: Spx/MgsR family RNA polymerase-binding regulatory protein [Arenimonas sp.]